MTKTSAETWCEDTQAKLMAMLDAVWASIEASDDPVLIRKAREKARVCGVMAATARKIAAMVPARKPAAGPLPAFAETPEPPPHKPRALDRLKGGRRGRL
ncbi:hypothetical protein [Caulobacter sp.]|uniref:hypothetical protein n=1 Tax=Caulobacter sp. TaxID=78 RepID=UPI001AFEA9B5|nr:hypothetical protein [Caulobacter sp.]MBO9543849.1 hypothetical protein [Caulobacter sp.]